MPELPDIELYRHALKARVVGQPLQAIRTFNPFVLRSVEPSPESFLGQTVQDVLRVGKRIVLQFPKEQFQVIHLMIAGRLRWHEAAKKMPAASGKLVLCAWTFPNGVLWLTEAGTRKRAAIHMVSGAKELNAHDPGGIEPLECTLESFTEILLHENRTLKRALTNPRWFAGIGNAYSDEILHAAKLSPLRLTQALKPDEIARLHSAVQTTLRDWSAKLKAEFADQFPGPGEVTAFRPDFAAHGKFGQPCPVCGTPIQRIRYAENETDYCPRCQNEDRVLADRSLSRLLKDDWPKTVEELLEGR